MINDLNRVVLMGHIGADPKPLPSENAPVRLSLATSSHWMVEGTRNTRTDWHAIVVFGNLRKYAAKLKKGDRVYIEGEARTNKFERTVSDEVVTSYSTEYVVSQIERVTAKADSADESTDFNPEAEPPAEETTSKAKPKGKK
jgi:single-strand DNA-binding protein